MRSRVAQARSVLEPGRDYPGVVRHSVPESRRRCLGTYEPERRRGELNSVSW